METVNLALIEMGRISEEGRYLSKDLNSALNYFLEAKNNGFLDSEVDIDRIKTQNGIPIDKSILTNA